MSWRLPCSFEFIIKVLLFGVLLVIVLNIYILSVIFISDENYDKHGNKDGGVFIKPQLIKYPTKHHHPTVSPKKLTFIQTNTTFVATRKILANVQFLGQQISRHVFSAKMTNWFHSFIEDVKITDPTSGDLLKEVLKWVDSRHLYPETNDLPIGRILNSLHSSKIIKAENAAVGTQLKILVTLESGHKAIFKPQWYLRNDIIPGEVYAGKDRHNGEVAAFYLSWLLGLRRVPLTVGRRLNLPKEIIPVSSPDLENTFYQEGNNTCFYGVCYYCSPADPVCASQDILEGALILWLPQQLEKFRHPWHRSYKENIPARWQLDSSYCQVVRRGPQRAPDRYSKGPRLLDLVDTAIFDFLIDNGDRHHYEVFQNFNDSSVLLIDNGKSFGNPNIDHIDILAPLYQCCRLRSSTWDHLLWLHEQTVSSLLRQLLETSHIAPVLSDPHYSALDRRLLIVISAVNVCFNESNGQQNVITTY